LFQPFHTTKAGGLGLGLSICRTLVTSHGGRLWAERRAERGAAFYVALPVVKQDA
jgi:two-component system sensor kinase FixL